jgi:glycine betaine/proline transport system substrate-binding protein
LKHHLSRALRFGAFAAVAALIVACYSVPVKAQTQCGAVSIAEMNWSSAAVAAHLDKIVLEEGFGCRVSLVPGETITTFNAMNEKGAPDIAPEFWVNSVRPQLEKAVAEARLTIGAEILEDGAVEGWWIPKFVADAHPEIKTVQQALANPKLFPAENNPSMGAVTGCPSGWSCRFSTANLFRALDASEKGFTLVSPASAEALDQSIAEAFETKTGWLGYYWAPTAILGKYQMVKLSFNVPHDKSDWDACTVVPDCPSPKINSYPTSQAFTIVTRQFATKSEAAMDYIKKREWTNLTVNSLLAWQSDNKRTNEETARHFLQTMPEIWTKWVPSDVAERIKASL